MINRISINDVERQHKGHWFEASSKRFFNSRWDSIALQNDGSIFAYFISSERNDLNPRMYTIRCVNMRNGEFSLPDSQRDNPLFEFQKFLTKQAAYAALRAYLDVEPQHARDDLIAWLEQTIHYKENYEASQLRTEIDKLRSERAAYNNNEPDIDNGDLADS